MSWVCKLSDEAVKQFRRLPRNHQEYVGTAIDELGLNPLRGDVRPIKSGRFKGVLRKRVGRYRLIFSLNPDRRVVAIAAIVPRSDKTYR